MRGRGEKNDWWAGSQRETEGHQGYRQEEEVSNKRYGCFFVIGGTVRKNDRNTNQFGDSWEESLRADKISLCLYHQGREEVICGWRGEKREDLGAWEGGKNVDKWERQLSWCLPHKIVFGGVLKPETTHFSLIQSAYFVFLLQHPASPGPEGHQWMIGLNLFWACVSTARMRRWGTGLESDYALIWRSWSQGAWLIGRKGQEEGVVPADGRSCYGWNWIEKRGMIMDRSRVLQ